MAEKFTLKLDLDTAEAIVQGKSAADQIAKEGSKAAKYQLAAVLNELKASKAGSAGPSGMNFFSWGTDDPNSWKTQFSPRDIGPGSKSMTQLRAGLVEFKKLMEGYSGAIPPIIQKAGVNWKQMLLGAGAGVFSPWIGARMMSGGFFGGNGSSGGGRGGMGGSLLGPGGIGGFAEFYLLIQSARTAIQFAFRNLSQAIQEGSKLFQESARTARSISGLFQIQSAFSSVGISPDVATRMLEQGQFSGGRGRFMGSDEAFGNIMKSLASSGQLADMQQLMNMSEQFKRNWHDSALDAKFLNRAVPDLEAVAETTRQVSREWHTMWQLIGSDMSEALIGLGNSLKFVLQVLNTQLAIWRDQLDNFIALFRLMAPLMFGGAAQTVIAAIDAITRRDQPGNARSGGAMTMGSVSQWERMGLITNGGIMGNDFARETAQNTRRIVELMVAGRAGDMSGQGPIIYSLP